MLRKAVLECRKPGHFQEAQSFRSVLGLVQFEDFDREKHIGQDCTPRKQHRRLEQQGRFASRRGDGNSVEGFQVHLGGSLGLDSGFGRKLRQHKVTSDEVGDYIDRVVRNFVKHRNAGERFAQWAIRAEEGDLR